MEKTNEKWWEKLGKPQYGGELVIRLNRENCKLRPVLRCASNPDTYRLDGKTLCR